MSVAQTTGLEMIIMGDLNIDFQACSNNKWLNLEQLFDLTQLVTKPTRITQYSLTLIDHVYTTNPENISECYVSSYSISDHFPVCFSRKTNCKISKNEHITTTYRSFKNFNETHFLQDLATDLGSFSDILVDSDINKFPDQLKMAKLYPLHKGGSKSDPANYRPISILPTISKFFEKHINKHLVAFLNKYKVIHANQSGFRQKHSCQTDLVKLFDQWMACIDRGDIVGSVFLDFRKAFDLVDHSILIDKLSLYKCQGPDLNLISSYLQSRQQVIDSGKGLSTPAYIKSGVPQGSILGPTLFSIFINDLPLHMEYCDIDLFADDATFHANGKTKSEVEPKLQTDGNNPKSWAKHHKMLIHYD